jgi:ADP-heptose:LPS heptosyltransferase
MIDSGSIRRILVVRRDNIGDLLCTTPLLSALRRKFADAWIGVLTNSYAAPVLAGNPDIDEVLVYEKGKHLASLPERMLALGRRAAMITRLRRQGIDVAVLPASGNQRSAERFARWSGARRIVRADDGPAEGSHEVEMSFRCARPLGIAESPSTMTLVADPARVAALAATLPVGEGPLIGLHISARKPSQRWPVERFTELARRLHAETGARFLLFWAPGAANDAKHPGDDDKAANLTAHLNDLPVTSVPTHALSELIAGLSLCDRVICSDGGAMHIAAALGKPMVCFFGNSGAERWRPWGVAYQLLQAPSRDATDITVDEAIAAYRGLGGYGNA